jgi:hypothetical protein
MSDPLITILLDNHAPRLIDPAEWPVLIGTPTTGARILTVRQHVTDPKALVYGQNGVQEITFAGMLVSNTLHPELLGDAIASAIFRVGSQLWMDEEILWSLVLQLAPIRL